MLGVGPGSAVRLGGERAIREQLPLGDSRDSLWAVSVADDGTATVIGQHSLLQRDPDGTWTRLRSFSTAEPTSGHFAVLANGDMVVGGDLLQLWQRSANTPPLAVLYSRATGEAAVSALHALGDGRLVAGFANPDAPGVAGWIEVWAPPFRPGRAVRLQLPLNVSVTSIADDGYSLFVAGKGGTMSMPLAALPSAVAPQKKSALQHP